MVTLSTLPINSRGIIRIIDLDAPTRTRLLEMGFLKGTKIKIKAVAPLGDPILIQIKGQSSSIAIRKIEANKILVTPI
jgi:ferrous iron transport protein A